MSDLQQTLTIIRGLPGSGKSTLAKALSTATGAEHFEADQYHVDGVYNWKPENVKAAHQWCQDCTKIALSNGRSVIVSNTFTQQWEVAPYLEAAKAFSAKVQIITVDGDFGNIHNVPSSAVEKMRERWESIVV